jgi:FkbM family methyltransferase
MRTSSSFGSVEEFTFSRLFLTRGSLNVTTVLDIGANRGEWATNAKKRLWPNAEYYLVEANPQHWAQLKALGYNTAIAVLGDADKNVTMYEASTFRYRDTGNSVYQEIGKARNFHPVQRQMIQLDHLTIQKGWPSSYDLIKMDVQGAEKLVMQGGQATFRGANAVIMELAVAHYNKDAPLMFEMQTFTDEMDFRIFDIVGYHYGSSQQLLQVDALFVRKSHPIWGKPRRRG